MLSQMSYLKTIQQNTDFKQVFIPLNIPPLFSLNIKHQTLLTPNVESIVEDRNEIESVNSSMKPTQIQQPRWLFWQLPE